MSRVLQNLRRRRVFAATTLAMLAVTVGALAFWAAHGSGTATGSVGTLAAPTGVAASASGEGTSVSWSGATPPAGTLDGYYVQRFSGSTPTPACGSSPTTLLSAGTVSCTDTGDPSGSGVPAGTYTYKVTAVWRSWTARSSASNAVEVAPVSVTSTSPSSRGQGASKQTVAIKGTNFLTGATSSFGAGITVESTTFVSSTELKATITVNPAAATGSRPVSVTNPGGSKGSLAGGFTVNPGPTVESTSPGSGDQGGAQNVIVKGTNFAGSSTVSLSGSGVTINSTTFESATQIKLNVTVATSASTGARTVTVTNTDAGAGSLASGFTVNGKPTIESTGPSSRGQGASKQLIAVKGTNFESGATSNFGAGITVESTSFVSSTELAATVSVESGAATGARTVTVNNPDTTTASLASAFTVNTKPTVEPASPSSRGQGASKQTITIKGKGFVSGATLNSSFGAGITVESTSFTSSTELKATISIESGAATGSRTVTVTNGDGGSGSLTPGFTVNAKPTVESTSPSSRGQGAGKQTITIKGANFASGASANFGAGITVESTSLVSATELTAKITIESGAATGARTVTVTNADGGAESLAGGFTVNAGPTVESLSPGSGDQGGTENVIVKGTNFAGSSTVSLSGSGVTINSTTFESPTQIRLNVTIASGASTGARTVTVTNADAGSGLRASGFTVNGAPALTATSPSSGNLGGTENVTLKGTNFESGASASFGTGITVNSTTFVSTGELTANITIASNATTGARTVTVTNPDTTGASLASGFTISGAPTVTSISPSSRGQGASNQSIAVKGTNLENGANATFSGTGITVNSTTFVSAGEVTANITIASNATTGARTVTVTNPDTTSASLASAFTVNAGPTIATPTAASPINPGHNGTATFTMTGTNFISGLTVSGNGTAIVLKFTRLTTTSITVEAEGKGENKGLGSFTVTNPDGGSATSDEGSFKNG
jgi:hypothetical protein